MEYPIHIWDILYVYGIVYTYQAEHVIKYVCVHTLYTVACMIYIISIADSQPPNITRHPMSGRILVGLSHTLICSAIGSGTLRFSWERSSNGNSWTTVSDSNTTSYTTDTTLAIGEYMYRCNVSNEGGSVVSNNATVIVYGE